MVAGLDALGIAYHRNTRLVRGLDYYCHTTFEFVTDALGAQGTVMAGGRYDGLVETMSGPAIPGVGWAAGIERLALLVEGVAEPSRPIAIVPMGGASETAALQLAHRLRRAGYAVEHGYSGNVGKRLKRAVKLGARAALILGEDELARGMVQLRDLDAGAQEEAPLDRIEESLARFR